MLWWIVARHLRFRCLTREVFVELVIGEKHKYSFRERKEVFEVRDDVVQLLISLFEFVELVENDDRAPEAAEWIGSLNRFVSAAIGAEDAHQRLEILSHLMQ